MTIPDSTARRVPPRSARVKSFSKILKISIDSVLHPWYYGYIKNEPNAGTSRRLPGYTGREPWKTEQWRSTRNACFTGIPLPDAEVFTLPRVADLNERIMLIRSNSFHFTARNGIGRAGGKPRTGTPTAFRRVTGRPERVAAGLALRCKLPAWGRAPE